MTLWTVVCQAPLSTGFSRQEYWNELPFPSPGDFPDPEVEPRSPALRADSLPCEIPGKLFFSPVDTVYSPKTSSIYNLEVVLLLLLFW